MKILDDYRVEMLENLLKLEGYVKTIKGDLNKQTSSPCKNYNLVEVVEIEEGKIKYRSYCHDWNFDVVDSLLDTCFNFSDYQEACEIVNHKILCN
ncbi:MAG: hypothetical protein ACRC18_06985 [Cetobacterium sp.]